MHVILVRDIEGVATLRDEWQSLLDRSQPNLVFMTCEWILTWWRHFSRGQELFVLIVKDKEEIIGILPLMLSVHGEGHAHKIRFLHFIGYRTSDWMDIIATRKRDVIRAALEYLEGCQHLWDYMELFDIPEDSDTIAILSEFTPRTSLSFQKESKGGFPYLSTTPDWGLYYQAHVPRKIRVDLDRQIKRLRAKGELEVVWPDASNLTESLDAVFIMHQQRQEARQQHSIFSQPVYQNFHRDLARAYPLHHLDCPVLKLNDKVIAAHFGFRYNHKLYYYRPTFDPDYSAFSPGKVLLRYIIENCFADDEMLEFDFLFGNEPYKYEWATGERRGCRVLIGSAY